MTLLTRVLPHQTDQVFLTDGGIETWLNFNKGVALREFASFELLATAEGRAQLRTYFDPFMDMAHASGVGYVLATPTWRANPDWGEVLG